MKANLHGFFNLQGNCEPMFAHACMYARYQNILWELTWNNFLYACIMMGAILTRILNLL